MISDVSKREFKELCYKKNRIAQRANWMEKNSLFESAFDRWVFAAQGRWRVLGGAGGLLGCREPKQHEIPSVSTDLSIILAAKESEVLY